MAAVNPFQCDGIPHKLVDGQVIRGSFHQADFSRINPQVAGTQCLSICLVASVMATIKDPRYWTQSDVDKAAFIGTQVHEKRLADLFLTNPGRDTNKLTFEEGPPSITVDLDGIQCRQKIDVKADGCFGTEAHISLLLKTALRLFADNSFILRFCDYNIGILNSKGFYYIFNPHCCDNEGLQVDCNTGKACLLSFLSVSTLIRYVEVIVGSSQRQVDLYPIIALDTQTRLCDMEENVYVSHGFPFDLSQVVSATEEEVLEVRSLLQNEQGDICDISSNDFHKENEQMQSFVTLTNSQEIVSEMPSSSLPTYSHSSTIGMTSMDVLKLIVLEKFDRNDVCKAVPTPDTDTTYLVDLTSIHEKDLGCDDSGSYTKFGGYTTYYSALSEGGDITGFKYMGKKKPLDEKEENIIILKRYYSYKTSTDIGEKRGTRIISRAYHCNGMYQYAVIQYIGCKELFTSHHRKYLRTKPSVIQEASMLSEIFTSPKKVITIMDKNVDNLVCSPSDRMRNRMQVSNAKRAIRHSIPVQKRGKTTGMDMSKLRSQLVEGTFLRDIQQSSRKEGELCLNTFAASDFGMRLMQTYCCTTSKDRQVLGIDMTYAIGKFYVTLATVPCPYLRTRLHPSRMPTILTAMATTVSRHKNDYLYLANELKKCKLSTLIYGTDGEIALEMGMEETFPISKVTPGQQSIHLRCFLHARKNISDQLEKLKSDKIKCDKIISDIFGRENQGIRTEGLVDVCPEEFNVSYDKLQETWPKKFQEYMVDKRGKVCSWKEILQVNMKFMTIPSIISVYIFK